MNCRSSPKTSRNLHGSSTASSKISSSSGSYGSCVSVSRAPSPERGGERNISPHAKQSNCQVVLWCFIMFCCVYMLHHWIWPGQIRTVSSRLCNMFILPSYFILFPIFEQRDSSINCIQLSKSCQQELGTLGTLGTLPRRDSATLLDNSVLS